MSKSMDERTRWLEKALEGQEPTIKARVLEIILKYGIDPQNEFFMIFVALGFMQTLIQDSPRDWQDLFHNFQQELGQWSATNLETLALLAQKAEITEQLVITSQKLTTTLAALVEAFSTQSTHLNSSSQASTSLKRELNSLKNEFKILRQEVQSIQERQAYQANENLNILSQKTDTQIRKSQLISNASVIGLLIITTLTTIVAMIINNQTNRRFLEQTNQKVEWLLQKQNRRDCLDEILDKIDPVCSNF